MAEGTEVVVATDVAKLPAIVMDNAIDASKKLKEVVSKKTKPVLIKGEQYLEFEDWQTLARFYGIAVSTGESESFELDGVKGAKARAEVRVISTGIKIGGAEAFCLRDEPNWEKKPFFQLASMAQTRAGAKALRNVLSWVAVLAGYRSTPAEEIIDTEAGGHTTGDAEPKISDKQGKMLYAKWKAKEIPDDEVKKYLKNTWGIEHTKDIAVIWFDDILRWIENWKAE